jgi:predicted transposase YbfD/YdcC
LADTEWDSHIRAIIRVNRDVLTRSTTTGLWRDSSETALFVSDVMLPAAQCAKAICDHWHIENRSHYVRDGSFAEDACRIRCNPGIFARSFAANILRLNGIHNVPGWSASHRLRRHQCNPRHARHVLSVEQPWGLVDRWRGNLAARPGLFIGHPTRRWWA